MLKKQSLVLYYRYENWNLVLIFYLIFRTSIESLVEIEITSREISRSSHVIFLELEAAFVNDITISFISLSIYLFIYIIFIYIILERVL